MHGAARPIIADSPLALAASPWADYALIDSGGGRKLERYGAVTVVRPESQCLWTPALDRAAWMAADAVFEPSDDEEAGRWRLVGAVPKTWPMRWRDVHFLARLTAFRHLGVFPEQAANWEWLEERARDAGPGVKVMNMFGYTGIASLAISRAGAKVTHVDASKKAIGWARDNGGAEAADIRWICEDACKWVGREARRGARYDGIVLDPPKYGRGPAGEVWRLNEDLPSLLKTCSDLLSDDARFLLLNAYSERLSGLALAGLLADTLDGRGGVIEWGELTLLEAGGGSRHGPVVLCAVDGVNTRVITSLNNPAVKAARALHLRKEREETGLFLVEGLKSVTEAVQLGRAPRLLLYGEAAEHHPLLREAAAAAAETALVSEGVLAKISRRDNPQAVLGVFEQSFAQLHDLDPAAARCWVALEAVRDPGNLGTIIRTADAAGCGAVILVGSCCDPFSVEAVRATMGSIFAVPLLKAAVTEFVAWVGGWPGSVVGTRLEATKDFRDASYAAPTLLVMGNEQAGLTNEVARACGVAVKIPMRGRADSLNLAVATGVMIYAATA